MELTNYHSDFEKLDFKWNVEIHRSQGEKAKIYTPMIDSTIFPKRIENTINIFTNSIIQQLKNANDFKWTHCKASKEIKKNKEMGTDE